MTDITLPKIMTVKEVSDYLRSSQGTVLRELEAGRLHGFKISEEWRCSEADLLAYISGQATATVSYSPEPATTPTQEADWKITGIKPFDFYWPKKGGGGSPEHYDKAYDATKVLNGRYYTFRVGFGNREVAGQMRRRVTIWIGSRAVVEFAGSNNYENDGLLAGVVRLKNGKQLSSYQSIPREYSGFRLDRYNSVVDGPRASTNMAVIADKDDLITMLEHAFIRATWKELL